MNRRRVLAIIRFDLLQLRRSRDFWIPMAILAAVFFVVIPLSLLFSIQRIGNVRVVQRISQTLDILPESIKQEVRGDTPAARASYALAVFLFAPLAVVVPLTISSAVGAQAIVGERERGSGEFLAHSPATEKEIYAAKMIGSFIPGYAATILGFGLYAIIVNLIVGPDIGGWFFPTGDWWVLMFWMVPPFIALALGLIVHISARVQSSTAAQQATGLVTLPLILVAYGQSSGSFLFGVRGAGWLVGAIAWLAAILLLLRGTRSLTRERLLGVDTGS